MSAFDEALAFCQRWESQILENDPHDPGGKTIFGIAETYYPPGKITRIIGTEKSVEDLTVRDARLIFLIDYWDRLGCGQMPEPVGFALFDFAVNPGQDAAARALQKITGAKADGVVGPKTLAAARAFCLKHGNQALVRALLGARMLWWMERASNRERYLRGWLNRLVDCAGEIGAKWGWRD